ncbi:uncharacterized protein troap isoform X2 [Paralichthys olivaceus]|uniref:uncharacterized protein troap isoform X2 n=1 Tax=Paralichthys olivaceus TaxID=8255 RepID=UPI0037506384
MDSPSVLRQQSQNKIHSDFLRMKNEHNKILVNQKPSKPVSAPHLSKQDNENKDPGRSDTGRKAAVRPAVSRLPVLAKSLHLQTPIDFRQSHCRWEEKPLAGKAKKKKPCTRPVPFNLSQPKSSTTSENPQPGAHAVQPEINSALSAETCLENMNRLSLKDPTKSSYAAQNTQLTTQVKSSKSSTGENFQPDHAAFLSILRNEGVSTTALGSATPQSKQYNCLPLRVSIMKSRSKAAATTGLEKLVQFSPDTAALQSILQNQGVNAGGLVGATPGKSVCPSGRGTSIYTAQRVPIRKNLTEATGGPVVALKETPQRKWTPQRIRDTRHQPISAMKWHLSTQQSPYTNTPGLRSCKTNLQPHPEEIVQRLFDDQEEQNTDKDPETQTEQLPVQALSTKPHCEEKGESSRTNSSEDDEEQRVAGVKLFLQAPQRESVIFFSTCKKLVRAPLFEKSSSDQDQHVPVSSEQRNVLPLHEVTSSVSEPTCQINASVQSLRRDLIAQKTHNLSPVVALLRKRLPPLEELRMDEEVATYTSVSVPAAPGFVPPRPRCRNPLASVLHFEESSRFVPIGFDLPSGSSSPHGSAQQER